MTGRRKEKMKNNAQSIADKKYRSKFKQQRLLFTPEEMADLTEYCKEHNVPKTVFCKEVILKEIYGGIKMKNNVKITEIDVHNLAKIFLEYNFFSDDRELAEEGSYDDGAISVLYQVYGSLSLNAQEALLEHYKVQKWQKEHKK